MMPVRRRKNVQKNRKDCDFYFYRNLLDRVRLNTPIRLAVDYTQGRAEPRDFVLVANPGKLQVRDLQILD